MDMTLENRSGLPTVESPGADPFARPRVRVKTTPNHPMQRTASQRAFARCSAAADQRCWVGLALRIERAPRLSFQRIAVAIQKVAAAVFIAVGLVLLVGLGRQAIQAVRSTSWPTVEGVVTESKVVQRTGGRNRKADVPRITYRYSVNGIEHVGARLFYGSQFSQSWGPTGARWTFSAWEYMARYPPGTLLRVHYDPDEAATSVVEAGLKSAIVLPMAFSIVMCGGGIFLGIVARRGVAKLARQQSASKKAT